MRILVIGCGRFGLSLIDRLSNRGHDVVAVDINEENVDEVNNTMDAMAVCGSGIDYDVLTEVEASKVDLCITCTNHDESTLLAAHLAKGIGAKFVIACVSDLMLGTQSSKFIKSTLDIDLLLNPDFLAVRAMYDIIFESNAKKVFLLGGNIISTLLANELIKHGHSVSIMDNDEEVCANLANSLPEKANIIVGDGAKHDVLEKEGLLNYDAFVTLTAIDAVNILASLYAQDHNVPTVITKINKISYKEIVTDLNLQHLILPRFTTIDIIDEYIETLKVK